jgi:YfiH family protein
MRLELPLSHASRRGWVSVPFAHPAWLTLRSAGDMRDAAARQHALATIGIAPESLRRVRQVHSRTVIAAEQLSHQRDAEAPPAELPEADGLVSASGGPFLAVGVGDCMPIYLADLRTGAYGILHSGWRGTGILREAVRVMGERYGTRAADLVALFGPCISAQAYAVDEQRAREFALWGPEAVVHRDDRPYLDMRAANAAIARDLGIGTVTIADHCTYSTPELGSYRREGPDHYTGMLAIVGPMQDRATQKTLRG